MDRNVRVILAVLIKIAKELSQVLRYPGILRYFWWITICSLLAPLLACQPGKRWRPLWCSRQIRPCVGRSALYGAKAYIETTFMRGIMFIFLSLIWSSCLLLFRTSWAWNSISLIYNLSHWDHTHTLKTCLMPLKCFTPLFLKESISFSSKEFLLRCNTSGLFCGFLISCAHLCATTEGERRMVSTTDSNCLPRLFITSSLHNSSPCKIEQLENVRHFGFPGLRRRV